ncbi:hypothetical protein [Catellatospora tritici]|uniref:hypothetical protein n=1 Tax=Catellatospora tritici TaxID=2851566 RepID=UPI001C2D1B74|nr:hypothetical protein [Catellatospora tritici]MBV1854594.1 hypothetical protein [Catellatospora tritici]
MTVGEPLAGSTMKPAEALASRIVATVLSDERGEPVTIEDWDIPPRQGAHDFWLHTSAGREALEITRMAEQDTITHAMHWRKTGPGFEATVSGLSSAWMLVVDQEVKATALTEKLAEWLRALETEGITKTGKWDGERIYQHPITNGLAAAGVLEASAVAGPPAGMVVLSYVSNLKSRPAGDPNHTANELTEILKLDRHQKDAAKLGRSGASERHLFMWVDMHSRWDVVRAFDEGDPTAAPVVDSNITTVWLAVPTPEGAEVLRWSALHGWRRHNVTA